MDLISMLGYSNNSPFRGNPYLDIHTPEGLIDMSNTDMDLIGIDNKGNKKKMKAGRKNPYKFEGDIVREIPAGNPYQKGGMTPQQLFNFLFEGDDEEEQIKEQSEQAKMLEQRELQIAENETRQQSQLQDIARQRRIMEDEAQYNEAMMIAYNMFGDEKELDSPANLRTTPFGQSAGKNVNPNVLKTEKDIFSEFKGITNLGIWGDEKHKQRISDHNTGDAQDFGISNSVENGNKIAQKLMTEAKQRNVKYIIFNGKIWNPSISNEWRPYSGKNPHSTHVHVSYNR